jgi:hypothetical protein
MIKYLAVFVLIFALCAPANASLSVIWIMDAEPIPDTVKERLQELGVHWHIINKRAGKLMIDAIIPTKEIAVALKDYLVEKDYNPTLVGLWKYSGGHSEEVDAEGVETGVPSIAFRDDLYLLGMPDECTGDPAVCVRPTEVYEAHQWAGWPFRHFD